MKIVDRKTFLSLPAGTLFSKFEPDIFSDIRIKEDTCGDNDWFEQQIADAIECSGSENFADKCDRMVNGESVKMDFDCIGRDGCFDDDQLFAVWEQADIDALIARLQKTKGAVI